MKGRDGAPGESHAGDECPDLVRQTHRVAELRDAKAPTDRQQKEELPNRVENDA